MMNVSTGRSIAELDHVAQSIADIITTPIGSRLMRRDYGSLLSELIDQPGNGATSVRVTAAIAGAVMKWEPRVRLSRVQLSSGERMGQFILDVEGLYTPMTGTRSVMSLRMPLQLAAA
jgi:phage baseplate assembly protein W